LLNASSQQEEVLGKLRLELFQILAADGLVLTALWIPGTE